MDGKEMIPVTIYRDSTDLFTDAAMEDSNLCDMFFPDWIVKKYYNAHENEFVDETGTHLNANKGEEEFCRWYDEVYTADDTVGLYRFAVDECGFKPDTFYCY